MKMYNYEFVMHQTEQVFSVEKKIMAIFMNTYLATYL